MLKNKLNEREIRQSLVNYGCGFIISEHKKHDTISAYPTRMQGINKIHLTLRVHIDQIHPYDLLQHLLGFNDFQDWNAKDWESWL